MTLVRERMSGPLGPIAIDATLVEAAREMRSSGAGGLPVLDPAREGACVGVVTERDIVIRVLAEERDARFAVVRDIATLKPVTCRAEDELGDALALMRKHEVQHLPVTEGDQVVGVLSLADIVFGRPNEERRGALDPGMGRG